MKTCSSFLCPGREGKLVCTKCKGAEPPTVYCSEECQTADWKFHKLYCGKQAYVFSVELMNSSNPTIRRTVAVPSWFTFQQFHFTLQYILAWKNSHPHIFDFVEEARPMALSFDPPPRSFLKILQPEDDEIAGDDERKVKLADVYEPNGALQSKVSLNGAVAPLVYTYDFGDFWEHKITFHGSELARAARPLVKEAVGCAPIDDCGGVTGWNELKADFLATTPTQAQRDQITWAKAQSGVGEDYDPNSAVNVTESNYEGRWENHYEGFLQEEKYRVNY